MELITDGTSSPMRRSSSSVQAQADDFVQGTTLSNSLPSGWHIPSSLAPGIQSDGLYVRGLPIGAHGEHNDRCIAANRGVNVPQLLSILDGPAAGRDTDLRDSLTTRRSSSPSASAPADTKHAYYFEVFLIMGESSDGFSIGFHAADCDSFIPISGQEPGQATGSIGLHMDGDLLVSGNRIRNWTRQIQSGETIGCGVIFSADPTFFFTRNGDKVVGSEEVDMKALPSSDTWLYPSVVVSSVSETILRTNFSSDRFQWKGEQDLNPIWPGLLGESAHDERDRVGLQPPTLARSHTVGASTSRQINDDCVGQDVLVWRRSIGASDHRRAPSEPTLDLALHDVKAMALELRNVTNAEEADVGSLKQLIDLCLSRANRLRSSIEASSDHNVDFVELVTAFESVNEAIEEAQTKVKDIEPRDVDIFAPLCHMRSKKHHTRVEAIRELLGLIKKGHDCALNRDILTHGGMSSVLTLYYSSSDSDELMTLSALATVYLLPLMIVSAELKASTNILMGTIECILHLIGTSFGEDRFGLPSQEIRSAVALAMGEIWWKVLSSKLAVAEDVAATLRGTVVARSDGEEDYIPPRRRRIQRRKSVFTSHARDDVEYDQLVYGFAQLTVLAAKTESKRSLLQITQPNCKSLLYQFVFIVESVCNSDFARPAAINAGLLELLFLWLKSRDIELERPAANLLCRTVTMGDDYSNGFIHSQIIAEGLLANVMRLLESEDSSVRLSMVASLSSMTRSLQARNAIIQAQGVRYIVQLLGSLTTHERDVELATKSIECLLRLAGEDDTTHWPSSSDGLTIATEIISNGALLPVVALANADQHGLRSLATRIITQISKARRSALQLHIRSRLCESGAVACLGKALLADMLKIRSHVMAKVSVAAPSQSDLIDGCLTNEFPVTSSTAVASAAREARSIIQGLFDILRSDDSDDIVVEEDTHGSCMQLSMSGGIECLLWITILTPGSCARFDSLVDGMSCHEMQIAACQSLAFITSSLYHDNDNFSGLRKWTPYILASFVNILKNHRDTALLVEILNGLQSLARCKLLQTKIVSECLTTILKMQKASSNKLLSDASAKVCLALGFNDIETEANLDDHFLGDRFILARSRLIQAMAREEIRQLLNRVWQPALRRNDGERLLEDETVDQGATRSSNNFKSLFQRAWTDDDSVELRRTLRVEVEEIYGPWHSCKVSPDFVGPKRAVSLGVQAKRRTVLRSGSYYDERPFPPGPIHDAGSQADDSIGFNIHAFSDLIETSVLDETSFLECHQYPLSDPIVEKDWIRGHFASSETHATLLDQAVPQLSSHVDQLLRTFYPSKLIRDEVLPIFDFKPDASFGFCVWAMPSGRYFSFRREGSLIVKECETIQDLERVHCSICFHNSTYSGEFLDVLLQTIYQCPMVVQALSFSNDEMRSEESRHNACHEFEGSEMLVNLLGRNLPSSLHQLTLDDVLSNKAAEELIRVIRDVPRAVQDDESSGSGKSTLQALALTNSPHIKKKTYESFVTSLDVPSSSLSCLKMLDLAGNLLGDELSAKFLSFALSPVSSSQISCLDMSRNNIGEGEYVKKVFEDYAGVSKPRLRVLNLSGNDLGVGDAALQVVASLGDCLKLLRCLDVSNNGLSSSAFLVTLGGSLSSHKKLVNLDISRNSFSPISMNSFFTKLHSMSRSGIGVNLAFVHLNGNVPPLSTGQELVLEEALAMNRTKIASASVSNQTSFESDTLSTMSGTFGGPKMELDIPTSDYTALNSITVLISAPLVWRDSSNNLHPIDTLDFKLEKSLLWQCFSEASRDIDLLYDNATTDRLQAVKTMGRRCLHFSGHGHPNSLTFEDGSGGIHWLRADQLRELVSPNHEAKDPPFDFVFVSACHSELAGRTFVECGVPHVVCCQQDSQLMDSAALTFTRAFYLALAVGITLKESFHCGQQAVRSSATVPKPEEEMKKFLLLPEDGNHAVPIFDAPEVSAWPRPLPDGSLAVTRLAVNNTLPSPPQAFVGREDDMYKVLNLVLTRRLVNVVGGHGIGRSSLVSALCHYIDNRKSTMMFDNIFFVRSLSSEEKRIAPFVSLYRQLADAGLAEPMQSETEMELVMNEVVTSMQSMKVLLVFDKTENIHGSSEAQDFHFFLRRILADTTDVHVLMTSVKPLGSGTAVGAVENVYTLGPLRFRSTVKLFAYLCPLLHSSRQRKDLIGQLTSHLETNPLAEPLVDETSRRIMELLGDGIPARTFDVANQITADTLDYLRKIPQMA